MRRVDLRRLRDRHLFGALTEPERGKLYGAALESQEVFDGLADDEELRELFAIAGYSFEVANDAMADEEPSPNELDKDELADLGLLESAGSVPFRFSDAGAALVPEVMGQESEAAKVPASFPSTDPQVNAPASADLADRGQAPFPAIYSFDVGDDGLKVSDSESLAAAAEYLCRHPGLAILIEGFSDVHETSSEAEADALAESRARRLAGLFESGGIDRSRIRTVSWGSRRPLSEESSEAARSRNRRARVLVGG